MNYSYDNLGNHAYLEHLVQRYNSNTGDPYYNLYQQDIDALEPSVVRQLGLRVGSHISDLTYSPRMQVALLELIRHAAVDRPHHGDIAITLQGQTGPRPHEINEEDIAALQEMTEGADDALIAGFLAAAGHVGAAADDGGGGGAAAVVRRQFYPNARYQHEYDVAVAAAAAAAALDDDYDWGGGLHLELRDPADAAPAPAFAFAGAGAGAGAANVLLPAHVAREVLTCQTGECAISRADLSTLEHANKAVTSCGHVFDKDDIEQWLTKHNTCPECRSECTLNPIHKADVVRLVGRRTSVPPHLKPLMVARTIKKGRIPPGGPAYMCNKCGNVVDAIPKPNKCPRCQKHNAFSGGSRKCKRNKKNSRRKSKKSIKRNKTIKRR
jgi:predicted Zn-ribbon and HTH transcriptional regulator